LKLLDTALILWQLEKAEKSREDERK
jgi:hypothetical protein